MGGKLFTNSGDESNGYLELFDTTVFFQHLPEPKESREATYQNIDIIKRSEPILVYQWTKYRTISFSLRFAVIEQEDAADMVKLNAIVRRSVLPVKDRGVPPLGRLYLGAFFVNLPPSLSPDSLTEDGGKMNFIVNSYTITPSKERLYDPDNIFPGGVNVPGSVPWWTKWPAYEDVELSVTIFAKEVWGMGSKDAGSAGSAAAGTGGGTTGPSGDSPTGDSAPQDPGNAPPPVDFVGPPSPQQATEAIISSFGGVLPSP